MIADCIRIAVLKNQQFRRTLHSQPPQILKNRHLRFLREDPAQVIVAAPDALPDRFQCERFGQVLAQHGDDLLDPLLIQQLLSLAEKFGPASRLVQRTAPSVAYLIAK